ncbi:uncharacterized protein LOC124268237 [Haliotis rubra]|uniref:uncharacterized protein LOC124268237 n=1 Tax=Haliotis rubra TaxID=36100 RepID=UPI001EE58B7B|nr:uncharacterized protein LOC124268237 [Haliotis rubra]
MARIKGFLIFGGIMAVVVTTLLLYKLDRTVFSRDSSDEMHHVSDLGLNRQAAGTHITEFPHGKQEAKETGQTPHSHVSTETPSASCVDLFEELQTKNHQLPRTNVIILTYMRSGSTLTGEMFSQHPDVFYVFEPMHTLKWIWWSQKTRMNFFDRPSRMIKSSEDFARAAKDIADGFLRCHPTKIDVATLSQHHLGSIEDEQLRRQTLYNMHPEVKFNHYDSAMAKRA